jgi:hypothetical protein
LGGIAGTLAGAAIGHNNHNTAAGALIGGAAGLVTGAAIGSAVDQKERARAYEYQMQLQQAARLHAVSVADVLAMTRSGVGDEVIINQIRRGGMERRIDTNDVILLHKERVSDAVIAAMQQYSAPAVQAVQAVPVPTPVYARPVIVEGYPYPPPPPPYVRYYYGPPRPVYYGPRPHWGITVYGH